MLLFPSIAPQHPRSPNSHNLTSLYSMSQILDEVLAANRKYAETFGDKARLALPPARRFAILTCMDAQ